MFVLLFSVIFVELVEFVVFVLFGIVELLVMLFILEQFPIFEQCTHIKPTK